VIAEAIYTILSTHSGLQALVGDRVYPVIMPAEAPTPAVTYQRLATDRTYTSDGPTGEATVTVQVDVWDNDPLVAGRVGDQVVKAMHGAWNQTVAGVELGTVKCLDEGDDYDEESESPGVRMQFSIQFVE
jgi:hypothetical protein